MFLIFLIKNDVEYISISLFNTAILSFHYHFVFVRSLLTENVTGIRSWISFVHFVFCFMKDTKISFLRHYLVLPVILINFPNYYIQTITMRCVSHHLHLSLSLSLSHQHHLQRILMRDILCNYV